MRDDDFQLLRWRLWQLRLQARVFKLLSATIG
jgi:hypothetical protein